MDMHVTPAVAKAAFLAEHLKPGEHYAGLILGQPGEPDYHLVLVALNEETANWKSQTDWAKRAGGSLPTRRELNLLRANLREMFKPDWYWCKESYEGNSAFAWYQGFPLGLQSFHHKSAALRAVAVRRIKLGE